MFLTSMFLHVHMQPKMDGAKTARHRRQASEIQPSPIHTFPIVPAPDREPTDIVLTSLVVTGSGFEQVHQIGVLHHNQWSYHQSH